MSDAGHRGERPDPDELLRRVQAEEAHARRGKLKIFFGFAPGVGKTYRMLQVARDLVSDQRLDVIIGLIETHRRMDTAAMMLGLDLLPRLKVEYRGRVLEEFDLDAALARRPQILLLDELAHSNAPGSRHAKRWQDVEELLEAGIDVFTTVNVQHVESLNDVIAQITHIQVRETIPDQILDHAESIELVDIAPEELMQRLREGKVYLPEQARRAADHFFQRGNLLALRELALRRTAQHVDEDVLEYREQHGVAATWPAGERILVGVGPAPSSGRLIRAAARMAAGLRCPFVAAYVEPPALQRQSEADRERLEVHLRIAESLGGTVTRLSGGRIADALLGYARRHNVTRLLVGKPTHSRLRDRLRGSLLDTLVRGSGDIEVHVISGESPVVEASPGRPARAPFLLTHYLAATLLCGVTLVVALLLRAALDLPDPEMLFLLAVMLTAVRIGRGPSLWAAALGVAAYDFFFVPPYHTFAVQDRRYLLTFAMMFGVGFVLSELAGRLKRQEHEALAREERTAVLYALSKDVAAATEPAQLAQVAAQHAAESFAERALVLREGPAGALQRLGEAPRGAAGSEEGDGLADDHERAVARWCAAHGRIAGLGTDTLPGAPCLCAPLVVAAVTLGVLVLFPRERAALRAEQRAFLDVFCRQVAAAFERLRLADEARGAVLRAHTEEMRSSLLSAVSHDLRTPLSSITGAATALRDDDRLSPATRADLISSICDEAERLERLVANLLDMTRLSSGALVLKRDWIPLDEVVGSALTRLERRLGDRAVTVTLAPNLPLLLMDPVLFEQVLINLLENAAKYTPPRSPVKIRAERQAQAVVIEVRDHGPGLPPGAGDRVFDKFYRGPQIGISGAGLGLPICRAIVEAHGGTIQAKDSPAGGAAFRVTLPHHGEPPPLPDSPEGEGS